MESLSVPVDDHRERLLREPHEFVYLVESDEWSGCTADSRSARVVRIHFTMSEPRLKGFGRAPGSVTLRRGHLCSG